MQTFILNYNTDIGEIYRLEDKINFTNTLKSYSVLNTDKEREEFLTVLNLSYPNIAKELDVAIQEGIVKNYDEDKENEERDLLDFQTLKYPKNTPIKSL